jgi:hypothetical protein
LELFHKEAYVCGMETKLTAVQWLLEQTMYMRSTKWADIVEQALEMEREQHGETWDAALLAVDGRGGVILRALPDFDEYWEQSSKTPPGEHCKEA